MRNRKRFALLLAAGLLWGNAAPAAAAETELQQELMEEEAPAGEPDQETAPETESTEQTGETEETKNPSSDKTADQDGGLSELIVDEHPTSGGGLPDGLSVADEIAESEAQKEAKPMVAVDPSLYPAANFSENAREVYWYCRLELGLNHAAACGVLANVQMESNFRPLALGDGGTSYGVCQWHLGRLSSLMAYCETNGSDYNTLEGQLSYLRYELNQGYTGFYRRLAAVPDTAEGAYQAGFLMCVAFEMPDQAAARGAQRGNLAKNNYYPKDFLKTASFTTKTALKVREAADEDAEVTANLAQNALVTIQELEGEWAYIAFRKEGEALTGYVKASMLRHVKETDPLEENDPKQSQTQQDDELKEKQDGTPAEAAETSGTDNGEAEEETQGQTTGEMANEMADETAPAQTEDLQ